MSSARHLCVTLGGPSRRWEATRVGGDETNVPKTVRPETVGKERPE